jgi:hypothetical protein
VGVPVEGRLGAERQTGHGGDHGAGGHPQKEGASVRCLQTPGPWPGHQWAGDGALEPWDELASGLWGTVAQNSVRRLVSHAGENATTAAPGPADAKSRAISIQVRFAQREPERQTGRAPWRTPVIPAAREAEVGRIQVPGQNTRTVPETPSPKQPARSGLRVQRRSACSSEAKPRVQTPVPQETRILRKRVTCFAALSQKVLYIRNGTSPGSRSGLTTLVGGEARGAGATQVGVLPPTWHRPQMVTLDAPVHDLWQWCHVTQAGASGTTSHVLSCCPQLSQGHPLNFSPRAPIPGSASRSLPRNSSHCQGIWGLGGHSGPQQVTHGPQDSLGDQS